MYPILFQIGDFQVTTFGVLVALGALIGLWIFHRELLRSGLSPTGVDAALVSYARYSRYPCSYDPSVIRNYAVIQVDK